MGHARPLFRLFLSFQTNNTIITANKCEKCPSSDSRLRELECSLPRHKVPCVTTLVTTLLGVPIFTSYQ